MSANSEQTYPIGYPIPELGILCLLPGPSVRRETDDFARKWCFGCCKHGDHRLVVLDYPGPSYYDPVGIWGCPTCHHDRTEFGVGKL